MGVLGILDNLKENKFNMKNMSHSSVTRNVMQTNLNIVLMNKEIVDMSKELMRINWAHGFNLKEEKKLVNDAINSFEDIEQINNPNTTYDHQSHSEVVQMNSSILQMNNDIIEMNNRMCQQNKVERNEWKKEAVSSIANEFSGVKVFDTTEKENRPPETVIEKTKRPNSKKENCEPERNRKVLNERKEISDEEEKKPEEKSANIQKDVDIILRSKDKNKTLLDIVRDKQEGDMYIVNTDHELTDTIKTTFERHGCQVTVSQLERDLIALYILLNKKIQIKKLRKLIERGKEFGLEFFLTKTGMTSSLMSKVHQIFKW